MKVLLVLYSMAKRFANTITYGTYQFSFSIPTKEIWLGKIITNDNHLSSKKKINTLQIAYVSSRQTTLFDKREWWLSSEMHTNESHWWMNYLPKLFMQIWPVDLSPPLSLEQLADKNKDNRKKKISLSQMNSFLYHAMISSISSQLDCLHQNVLNVKNHFLQTNYLFVQHSIVVIILIVFVVIIVIDYFYQVMNIIFMDKIKFSVDKIINN